MGDFTVMLRRYSTLIGQLNVNWVPRQPGKTDLSNPSHLLGIKICLGHKGPDRMAQETQRALYLSSLY